MPPHTTKRRTTTNLKTKNNQNGQKIELYGSLTTKELKKTGRRSKDRQLGQRGHTARQWLEDWAGKAMAGGPDGPTFACR